MENYLTAIQILKTWNDQNLEKFKQYCITNTFKDSKNGSAFIRLETEKYLIEVIAWNHAYCLDIQIIDIVTDEVSFPTVGSCDKIEKFKNHLKSFIEWFNLKHEKKT